MHHDRDHRVHADRRSGTRTRHRRRALSRPSRGPSERGRGPTRRTGGRGPLNPFGRSPSGGPRTDRLGWAAIEGRQTLEKPPERAITVAVAVPAVSPLRRRPIPGRRRPDSDDLSRARRAGDAGHRHERVANRGHSPSVERVVDPDTARTRHRHATGAAIPGDRDQWRDVHGVGHDPGVFGTAPPTAARARAGPGARGPTRWCSRCASRRTRRTGATGRPASCRATSRCRR